MPIDWEKVKAQAEKFRSRLGGGSPPSRRAPSSISTPIPPGMTSPCPSRRGPALPEFPHPLGSMERAALLPQAFEATLREAALVGADVLRRPAGRPSAFPAPRFSRFSLLCIAPVAIDLKVVVAVSVRRLSPLRSLTTEAQRRRGRKIDGLFSVPQWLGGSTQACTRG